MDAQVVDLQASDGSQYPVILFTVDKDVRFSSSGSDSSEVDSFKNIRWLSDGVGTGHVLQSQGFASRGRGLHRVWHVVVNIFFRFFM